MYKPKNIGETYYSLSTRYQFGKILLHATILYKSSVECHFYIKFSMTIFNIIISPLNDSHSVDDLARQLHPNSTINLENSGYKIAGYLLSGAGSNERFEKLIIVSD